MLVQSDMTYVHDMTSTYSHTYESLQSLHSDTLRSISVPGVPGLYVYIYIWPAFGLIRWTAIHQARIMFACYFEHLLLFGCYSAASTRSIDEMIVP